MITGFDHVAITVADMEASCAFYERVLGGVVEARYPWNGKPAVARVLLGGAMLNIHQAGNGIELVARAPTPGSADLCFRWRGPVADAQALLESKGVAVIEGPAPRHTVDGVRGLSVYFKDRDGNLIELLGD